MKKFKKILSAMLAVTMLATMAFCMPVSAATPTVTATIEGYTGEVDSTFNVVFSYSGVEGLFLDESTWDEKAISSLQFELVMPGKTTNYTGTAARGFYTVSDYGTLAKAPSVNVTNDNIMKVSVSFDGTAGQYSYDASNTVTVPVKVVAPYAETTQFTLQNCAIYLATYDAAANVSATETLEQTAGEIVVDDSAAKIVVGAPEPPAHEDPTVTITAAEGEDSATGAWTFYYTTVVTKGTNAITDARVSVKQGVREQIGYLSADLLANIEGDFTFYIGNTSKWAGRTYTATATVEAGDDTATATAEWTTPAE